MGCYEMDILRRGKKIGYKHNNREKDIWRVGSGMRGVRITILFSRHPTQNCDYMYGFQRYIFTFEFLKSMKNQVSKLHKNPRIIF